MQLCKSEISVLLGKTFCVLHKLCHPDDNLLEKSKHVSLFIICVLSVVICYYVITNLKHSRTSELKIVNACVERKVGSTAREREREREREKELEMVRLINSISAKAKQLRRFTSSAS